MPPNKSENHEGRLSRRALLGAVVSSAAAGAGGVALGYRFRAEFRALKLVAQARPLSVPAAMSTFRATPTQSSSVTTGKRSTT